MADNDSIPKERGYKGYTREDYERVAEECGSVSEAARELSVARQSVINQWKRYGITNPYTGEIPGQDTDSQ